MDIRSHIGEHKQTQMLIIDTYAGVGSDTGLCFDFVHAKVFSKNSRIVVQEPPHCALTRFVRNLQDDNTLVNVDTELSRTMNPSDWYLIAHRSRGFFPRSSGSSPGLIKI